MQRISEVILLVPSAREFDRGLRRGIVEYAQTHGPWVFLEEPPAYLGSLAPRQRMRYLRRRGAQGMIVIQGSYPAVRRLRIPTVIAIGTRRLLGDYCQVICADEEIGEVGAQSLSDLGLRHFGFCGLEGLEFSDRRCTGFVRGIAAAGHSAAVYSAPHTHLTQSWYTEQNHLGHWIAKLPKPVGIMACNDDRARLVAESCRQQAIRIPDEVSLLGVDNDQQVCLSSHPPLSSIALATERGGYDAARLLDSMMRGRTPRQKVVTVRPTHVVPRRSTDVLAIEDALLVKVLRFIRDNTHRDLRVQDLIAVSGLSRRKLQDRFNEHLGRSPIAEIHQCRVERLARLLVETNLTVSEIAAATGFEADAHVARFFSRRTGMTPLAYRKKFRTP